MEIIASGAYGAREAHVPEQHQEASDLLRLCEDLAATTALGTPDDLLLVDVGSDEGATPDS